MGKKKLILNVEEFSNNEIIVKGLVSLVPEYKLVASVNKFFVNKFFENDLLHHEKNYEFFHAHTQHELLFPVYANESKKIWLISNRTHEFFLFPELKPFNAILLIFGSVSEDWLNELKHVSYISLMQDIPSNLVEKIVSFVDKLKK